MSEVVQLKTGNNGISDLTEQECEALAIAPFMVYMSVAMADGSLDQEEIREFEKYISGFKPNKGDLFNLSISGMVASLPAIVQAALQGQFDPLADFVRIREILKTRVNEDVASQYIEDLLQFGHDIASSSGGFLGIGKVCRQEKQVLAGLKEMLTS